MHKLSKYLSTKIYSIKVKCVGFKIIIFCYVIEGFVVIQKVTWACQARSVSCKCVRLRIGFPEVFLTE